MIDLKSGLNSLPGVESQYKMAPSNRLEPQFNLNPPKHAKKAGVLILIYPFSNELIIPMMIRTADPGPHSRQICFPGGQYESRDLNLRQTALRESREEMGIQPELVQIVGNLTQLYIAPSNFLVLPVLGWSNVRPEFLPEPKEVESIIELPLKMILDQTNRKTMNKSLHGNSFEIPFFSINTHEIWGASAMILSELSCIIEKILKKRADPC